MARYFFSIENGCPYTDIDGLELVDAQAIRREAIGFAVDVMRMQPEREDWSGWCVRVTDGGGGAVLSVAFDQISWPSTLGNR